MRDIFRSSTIIFASTLLCALFALAGGDNPYFHFDENRIATWMNALQIFACALVSLSLFRLRKSSCDGAFLWLWISIGSLLLSGDELLSFHDYDGPAMLLLRKGLHLEFSEFAIVTDNFYLSYSDFILIGYGLTAIFVCSYFRHEFLQDGRSILFFLLGTLLLFASVAIDFNLLMRVHPSLDTRGYNQLTLKAWEESFKIVGFSAILAGLHFRWLRLRKQKQLTDAP